jgi:hypothetical protein
VENPIKLNTGDKRLFLMIGQLFMLNFAFDHILIGSLDGNTFRLDFFSLGQSKG